VAEEDRREPHPVQIALDPLGPVHLRVAVGPSIEDEGEHERPLAQLAYVHHVLRDELARRLRTGLLRAGLLLADVRVAAQVTGGGRRRECLQRFAHGRPLEALAAIRNRLHEQQHRESHEQDDADEPRVLVPRLRHLGPAHRLRVGAVALGEPLPR
jgi:hypothetical protein